MASIPTVILSTFPPLHCGIGRYAAQHAEFMRRQGEEVITIGLPGSEADVVVDPCGGRRPLEVLRAVRSVGSNPSECSLAMHWHDGHYFAGGFSERIPTALAIAKMIEAFGDSEIICHETYVPQDVSSPPRRILRALYGLVRRRAWLRADRLVFHSQAERRQSEAAHGGPWPANKVVIRGHSAFLYRYREVDRHTARDELGVPQDVFLFLCIGFLSEHKGFHLAVEAMKEIDNPAARLTVVGSVRDDDAAATAYASRLRSMAAHDDRVEFLEQFLSDEEYDTWNAAADVVVAPYLRAFSSSVVARARLFGRRVIVTDVGGLTDQVDANDIVIGEPDDLMGAMQAALQGVRPHDV